MKTRLFILIALIALLAPVAAEAQVTRLPGFFGRIYSDVEGYAYGSVRPLDGDAPRGLGWQGALTVLSDDDVDGLGLSFGAGRSAGTNPWRLDASFLRISPDQGDSVNGFGVSGAWQFLAQEGLYALNASAGAEVIEDSYDSFSGALNGEVRVPNTDLSFGASLGFTSVDFDFGGSESDLTAAIEGIYAFPDYGLALSAVYQAESDINDSGAGIGATWAIPSSFPIPNSNLRAGVFEEVVYLRYRTRF